MIRSAPNTEIPVRIKPPPISPKRIEKMKKLKPYVESQIFWDNILNGGLGTDDLSVISPVFNLIPQPAIDVIPQIAPEEVVVKFRNLIWNADEEKYYLETLFNTDPDYWECDRDSFLDDDIATNEKFIAWELEYPRKAKTFLENSSPKKRAKRVLEKIENGEKEEKGKKRKKKSLSRILQDGRGEANLY